MKILFSLLLGLVLISAGIHATIVEDIVNQKVSVIIEKGAQKNIIPLGAYYVYALSHFEELHKNNKTEYRVTAILKNLNNRTKISFSGLFNDDLNDISYVYNYSFFNGAKDLSPWNMGFHWLDYADSIGSIYCPKQYFSESSFWSNMAPFMQNVQEVPLSNVNTSNTFQDLMNYALQVTQGNYPPPSDVWFAPTFEDMGATFFNNYYVITYVFTSFANGGDYWGFKVDTMYQPCSGQKGTIYTDQGSSLGDWHDIL